VGSEEVIQLTGLDAMVADGLDPLAGNYRLMSKDEIAVGIYDIIDHSLNLWTYQDNSIDLVPGSETELAPAATGQRHSLDVTSGDLNGDGIDEQIAAWVDATSGYIYIAVGEMPGSLGRTTSAPAVVAHPDGSLDLAVRGYDDALWHRHYDGSSSSWGEWSNAAGGLLLSGPAIVSPGDGRSSAFVIGADNQVYGTGWQVSNRALMFDGVDDYVDLPDNFPNVTEFTFAAWVYWNGGDPWQRIFDFGQDTNSNMFLTPSNGTNMRFAITTGGGGSELRLNAYSPLLQNEWVHVAVTLNGSQGVLYRNGIAVDTQPITLTPQDVAGENTWLGKSQYPDPFFNGKIDEVAVFNRALSEAEVSTIYRSGWDSMSGQVLGLHMDESPAFDGTILADASGQGNHGTLYTSEGGNNKSIQVPSRWQLSRWQLIEPKPTDECDWAPLESWHGPTPEVPAPAAIARGSQLDLFRLGPDNTLCRKHSDDGITWGNWEKLGGMLASGPGAVSLGPDHMQVFARGVDGALWHLTYDGGDWERGENEYKWQRLELDGMDEGVTIASAPTAVSSTSGQIRVYVRGSDNKPYWIEYSGSTWEGSWNQGAGELASGLGAVWVTDHFELFAQKADGSLQQSSDGASWVLLDKPWLPACCLGSPINTGIKAYVTGLTNPVDQINVIDIETGHFLGDGREQIALAYTYKFTLFSFWQPCIGLRLYDVNDGFRSLRTLGDVDPLNNFGQYYPKIAAGEFDGDAPEEIALAYATTGGGVRVYEHVGYAGAEIAWAKEGTYGMGSYGMNDHISSIQVQQGW
jgi:hypothetical protein